MDFFTLKFPLAVLLHVDSVKMKLEIYETMQIKCKVEESAGKTTCPNDAFAIAHFKDFSFDGNEIFPSRGAESVIPIFPTIEAGWKLNSEKPRKIENADFDYSR